jgi:hypothetical protein
VVRGIVAIGNPALWWVSVPVTLWALVTGARDRDPRRLFSGLGYCFLYLPWGISPRQLNYSHYLFEAIPYACLSLGMLLDRHWDGPGPGAGAGRGYVVLVLALYFFFLPFLLAAARSHQLVLLQHQGLAPVDLVPDLGVTAAVLTAAVIFAATYVVVALGGVPRLRLDRTGAAVVGAAFMIAFHVVSAEEAFRMVDLGTSSSSSG